MKESIIRIIICVLFIIRIICSSTDEDLSWAELAIKHKDVNRPTKLSSILPNVAGVYANKTKSKMLNIEKTILVNVVSFDKKQHNMKYQHLLHNWFCYANHYGLRPMTFLVPHINVTFEEQIKDLNDIGIYSDFTEFPNELFFSIIAKKKTPIVGAFNRVPYLGSVPSFAQFGAIVMLVPLLEMLELGYDVIYIDLDVALVHDPIPSLVRGLADISLSIEMKTCICPSVLETAFWVDWKKNEPNTGIMHIRSSPKMITLVREWFQVIVDQNIANDQKVLYLEALGATISFDCNEHLNKYSDKLINIYKKRLIDEYLLVNTSHKIEDYKPPDFDNSLKYCFYNEYEFQNGKVSLNCAFNRGGSVSEYIIGILEQNFTYPFDELADKYIDIGKPENKTLDHLLNSLSPAIVHMNYCDDKIRELHKLGLWLPSISLDEIDNNNITNNYHCKNYNFYDTYYGKINWEEKISKAEAEMAIVKSFLTNGTILKLHRRPTIFMYLNGELRPFPNGETLELMGLDWKNVKYPGPYNIFKTVHEGPELPDLYIPPTPVPTLSPTISR